METIHDFLLSGAAGRPDSPAVVERYGKGLRTVTHSRLELLARSCADGLREAGVQAGDRVLIDAHTSSEAVAALMGCSMIGAVFVPVSPETPEERVRLIADSAEPVFYLAPEGSGRAVADGIPGTGRIGDDGLSVLRAPAPRARTRRVPVGTDPAYIVFTSGTTGRPKGVVMSHSAILAFYRGLLAQGVGGPGSRVASTAPFQFDFSLLDIGLALGSGGTLLPVPRGELRWPRRFAAFLSESGATQVNGVPSVWRPVLRTEPELLAGLEAVTGILYSGEAFPEAELARLQGLLPGARILNCFGSTESVACTFADMSAHLRSGAARMPIGTPHPGADITLVGEDGELVSASGEVGEIHLRSAALFTGYWGDPEATGAALVPDPFEPRFGRKVFRSGDLAYRGEDGLFYFVGRRDSLVKVRGNRIELGEVERRLQEHPGVAAAAVLALPNDQDEQSLLAFVTRTAEDTDTAGADGAADGAELRAHCAQTLPDYMLPREVRIVESIPTTANGKADRVALRALAAV